MTRWIAITGCLLSLAFAPSMITEAQADGMKRAGYSNKRCIAPADRWRARSTWVCKWTEKCCYDWVFRRGSCAADRCF
jgi:hypothetical protein